jgi:phenylacetate-CoA ligase
MSIDFRIRDFFYPRGIWELKKALDKTQWMDSDELNEYLTARLRRVLSHAGRNVPYYRNLFRAFGFDPRDLCTAKDISHLPLLRKRTVRRYGADLLSENADRFHPRKYCTSGTTGQPLNFYLDRASNALEFVYYWRHWGWAGYRLGDRFAELSSHFFLQRPELGSRPYYYQPLLRRLLLNSNQVSPKSVGSMAEAIRKYRPRFLKGMSSTLYFFALSLREAGIEDIAFKCVFSTGEVVTRMHRGLVETTLQSPLLDSYGHMERTVGIAQCLEGGYHVNQDYGLMEFVNVREIPGQKELLASIVGTSLYNRAMPLLRYDVGDEVELFRQPESCPCGRTLPLVKGVHGRTEDCIVTPEGTFITSLFIVPEFVKGIRFVQFLQVERDELEIRFVTGEDWVDESASALKEYTARAVGRSMKIRLNPVEPVALIRDPSGKIRNVIGSGNIS